MPATSITASGNAIKVTDPCLIWGLNYAIRRQVLFDVGGFHPDNIPKALQRYQGDGETGSSLRVQAAGLTALSLSSGKSGNASQLRVVPSSIATASATTRAPCR